MDAVVLVLVLDEGDDAAFVSEHVPVLGLLIEKFNLDSRIEIGQLFKALGQNFVLEIHFLENFLVGTEMDLGAGLVRFADPLDMNASNATSTGLLLITDSNGDSIISPEELNNAISLGDQVEVGLILFFS